MFKPQRKTKKSQRAREMISAIYHIPLSDVREDRAGLEAMYANLTGLGFEWVADENEWFNHLAVNPQETTVFSFIVGSPTHEVDQAASILVTALEAQGYKVIDTMLILSSENPSENLVKIEVLK